jgi:hypothetical protein
MNESGFRLAMNGQPIARVKDAIFVSLPVDAWQVVCQDGKCGCDICKEDGGETLAFWDTLVVSAKPPKGHGHDYASVCHFPERYTKQARIDATRRYRESLAK